MLIPYCLFYDESVNDVSFDNLNAVYINTANTTKHRRNANNLIIISISFMALDILINAKMKYYYKNPTGLVLNSIAIP